MSPTHSFTKRLGRRLTTVLVAVLVSLGLVAAGAPASAAPQSCTAGNYLFEETSDNVVASLTESVRDALGEGAVSTVAPASALDFDNLRVLGTTNQGEVTARTVTVPIAGEFELPSNLTVVFTPQGDLLTYSETLITLAQGDTYRVQIITDDRVTMDTYVDVSKVTESEVQAALDQTTASTGGATMAVRGVGAVATCLGGVLGVGGAVAWLIAGACAGSCSVPLTPPTATVCAACVGGFAVLGGASVTAVAACFKLL